MRLLAIALLMVGCGSDPEVAENRPDAALGQEESQLPPQGRAELQTWLTAGHYKSWACEEAPHAARPPGAHGINRICSNAALSASADGTYPAGAASVKEIFTSAGQIRGYAVGRKLIEGDAAGSWYWYEAVGSTIYADGTNASVCVNCHETADRDFVFTHVR